MPIYEFQHPITKEIVEVIQSMTEEHVYTDREGTKWERVWNAPNAAIDTEMDPYSHSDWMKRTAKKGMTLGEMTDLSKDLSQKRERNRGLDPIKQKKVTNYEKKTKKPHPNKSK